MNRSTLSKVILLTFVLTSCEMPNFFYRKNEKSDDTSDTTTPADNNTNYVK